jgi:transcriptional regulator with XRE-family HTH domain
VARSRKTGMDRDAPARPLLDGVNLNEIVAYNFRRARELRGLTQDEAADRLAPFLGTRLKQAAVSGIEGAYGGAKRREFDAQELLAFACGFDLPIIWFLIPPPGDHRNLQGTSELVSELYLLAMGRNDQLEYLRERFAELGHVEPDESDAVLERVYGGPTERTLADYPTRRKELLLAMLDSHADRLDHAADEMGTFFDHLRQVGIRGYVAEKANDPDYVRAPEHRGLPHPADAEKTLRAGRRSAQDKPRGAR